jgi:tetratricopeptide (TPR) repeat protein
MEEQNYYLLLELNTDPPELDRNKIEEAIKERRKYWTKKFNSANTRDQATVALKLLDQAEEDLKEPEKFEAVAKKATAIKKAEVLKKEKENYDKLNRYINVLSQKGFIYEHEISLLEKMFHLTQEQIKKQITAVPIKNTAEKKEETQFEAKDALSKDRMRPINESLANCLTGKPQWGNVLTLYDLLEMPEGAGSNELHKKAESEHNALLKLGAVPGNLSKKGSLAHAITVFKDEETRDKYDEALKIQRFQPVAELIKVAGSTGVLDPPVYEGLVKQSLDEGLHQSDAEERIRLLCKQENIRIGKIEDDNQPPKLNLLQCGVCGLVNDDSGNACKRCGNDLTVACKKCNAKSSTAVDHCSNCGVFFADLKVQEHYIKRAEWALLRNDFDLANEFVEQAKYYWDGNVELTKMTSRIVHARELLKKDIQSIEKLISERKFYTAEKDLLILKQSHPKHGELAALDRTIKNRINLAEFLLEKAGSLSDTKDMIECYMKALEECSDCEQAIHKLNHLPPGPPLSIEVKAVKDAIRIEWQSVYKGENISYVIARQEGSGPKKKIGETKYSYFVDKTSDPGSRYIYTVYTARADKLSENGISSGPIVRIGEVGQLRAIAGSEEITLSWKAPSKAKVEVWRKEGSIPTKQGDGTKQNLANNHEFIDKSVTQGQVYGYLVIAEYEDVHGKQVSSTGTGILAIPVRPSAAPISIEDQSDEIFFKWENPPNGSTEILCSEYPFDGAQPNECFLYNRFVRNVDGYLIEQNEKDSGRIRKDFTGILHILPVTRFGDCVIVGEAFVVQSIKPVFRVRGKLFENGEFLLTWRWPDYAEKVMITISEKGVSDPTPQYRECSKTYYDSFGGFKIDHVSLEKELFVTISVTEEFDGEKFYSPFVSYRFPEQRLEEIHYSLLVKKKWFFSRKKQAFLTIKSPKVDIQDIVVVMQKGRVPNEMDDGKVIKKIEAKDLNGQPTFDLTNYVKEGSYIKLFFEAENDSKNHAFVLQPKGMLKLF